MTASDYWVKRVLANELKANRLAATTIARQEILYRKVYKEITVALAELAQEVVEKPVLGDLTRTQLWRYKKYTDLKQIITDSVKDLSVTQVKAMDGMLETLYVNTLSTTLLDLHKIPIDYNMITQIQTKNLLNIAWNDQHYSSRIYGNNSKIAQRISDDITDLVIKGKNPIAIKEQLSKDLNVSYSSADRLVRTEASHFYNEASLDAYLQAGVQQVEVLVGADERVCSSCNDYQGVYDIRLAPRLPIHPNCRCCYAPIIS